MPLHINSFRRQIETDIRESGLKEHEKTVLNEVLKRKTNSVVEDNSSILDFSNVISSVQEGRISKMDMNRLGLFPSDALETTANPKKREEIIRVNFGLYEELEYAHLNGNPESVLERKYPEAAKKDLLKESWKQTDFTRIVNWIDAKKSKEAPVIKSVENELTVNSWVKSDSSTASGLRARNILVFNPSQQHPYQLTIRFDQSVRKEGIKVKEGKDLIEVQNSGHGLNVIVHKFKNDQPFLRVDYTDPETSKLFVFRILELPFEEDVLKNFQTNFLIKKNRLLVEDSDYLFFNPDQAETEENVVQQEGNYLLEPSETLKLKVDYALVSDQETHFSIELNEFKLPLAINPKSEPLKPISGLDVWKDKRQLGRDFSYVIEEEIIKLKLGTSEKTVRGAFRNNILLEMQLVDSEGYAWSQGADLGLQQIEVDLSNELKSAFDAYRALYKQGKQITPSLVCLKDSFAEKAEAYVSAFLRELKSLPENKPLNSGQKELAKLGIIYEQFDENLIKFTPFHPLNVAYQLCLNGRLGQEEVYEAILRRLSPANLVPLLGGDQKKTYIPVETKNTPEWLYYSAYLNSKQAVPKSYISGLVSSKLKSFTDNFNFLFSSSLEAPIKLNAVNMGDCKELLQGVFEYYRNELNRSKTKAIQTLLPIDITIYGSDHLVSAFEELTYYTKTSDVEEKLGVNLKTNNYEKEDLINIFLEKIHFYNKPFPEANESFEYAHIIFYQFDRNVIEPSSNNINKVKTGVSLKGLMADIPSVPMEDVYKTGFGGKHIHQRYSQLMEMSILYNALACVSHNSNNFESDKALSMAINIDVRKHLDKLYDHSQWVTYIDPKVDLDFFKEKDDLVIIHYSDQFNNSSGYDAITVSNKSKQYADVISEFLAKNKVETSSVDDALKVINFFNAINGDWLLKLIKQDSLFPREKISLLSGIKSLLSILSHPSILWVPISLEEILRVSGSAGLKQSDGLFSAKNLATKERSMSDDLLMIGLERKAGELYMHFHPVELKIGHAGLANKGIEQGERTAELLENHLKKDSFLGEFYRSFFGKLVITNAEKLRLYKVWEDYDWDTILNEYRTDLLNDNFEIGSHLESFIGQFSLVHFNTDASRRKLKKETNFLHAEFLEEDGYRYLVKDIDELTKMFRIKETGLDRQRLLFNLYSDNAEGLVPKADENNIEEHTPLKEDAPAVSNNDHSPNVQEIKKEPKDGIKVLFGQDINRQEEIIWEPNNSDLVMHTNTGIIGTMGTGKTQFTKSLIYQMTSNAQQNLGNEPLGILIFDYKGDYIKDDFAKATNAKVFEPYHLPYNPLALDATAKSKPMLPLHTANDIKETIANAFNLGNVQKQKLRDVIVEAYEAKGIYKAKRDSWTNPAPTLGDVCNIFMMDENVSQDSLYAAMSNLQDFEIFEPETSQTQSLFSLIEGVTVINLSGYDESIQNLIVAITLDAFYTQMQVNGHSQIKGGMRQLRKMILVDEADNFLSKNFNSIKKILKEGREFGVGTVLSTQFLNHFSTSENDYSNYILTWVIHRVNEIKAKEVDSLFSLKSTKQRDELIKTIKNLEKHHSIVNLAGSEPIYTKDKAFWELIS